MMEKINLQDVNLLDLPDMYIDFDQPVSVSCGLKNRDELLDFFIKHLNDWSENRYSVHQFAKRYPTLFSLWTAKEVPSTPELMCFRICFTRPAGDVLFHCKIKTQGSLQ